MEDIKTLNIMAVAFIFTGSIMGLGFWLVATGVVLYLWELFKSL